ncbi:MAG: hypothetical protein DRQ13_04100 [Ignavibacteriae bacterium]|nr:MAG: hypothetical protein DRQ13_04100 [Ignavibacteriota bacterium]
MNKLIFSFFIFLLTIPVMSQDSHYWNIQYGTRSTLLGGAVIGSVSDLSATYYNPGAVALFKDPGFILSARVYQIETITVEDAAGLGKELGYSTVVPSPSFVAFDLKFDFLGEARLALSILTRQKMDFEFQTRLIDSLDIIESSPGKENFAGGISIQREFNEVWAGITYASKLNDLIGFGLTGYIAYRSQRSTNETIIQILPSEGDIASYTDLRNYRYTNMRTLLKFGIGFNFQPLTLGLTVTTPSLNIGGSGSVGTHFFLNGIDRDGDGINDNEFDSNFQDEIASEYNSSWAVGFGGGYKIGKFKFHASVEWFDAIEQFFVLDTEPFESQGSGETLTNDLTHELKSITNYGFGVDYFSSESLIISGSFVTDFSARIPDTETNLTVSTWNIYHISGGTTFKVGNSDLTLGLEYAFGSKEIDQRIDITDPGNNENSDIDKQSLVTTRRIKILIGFVL